MYTVLCLNEELSLIKVSPLFSGSEIVLMLLQHMKLPFDSSCFARGEYRCIFHGNFRCVTKGAVCAAPLEELHSFKARGRKVPLHLWFNLESVICNKEYTS